MNRIRICIGLGLLLASGFVVRSEPVPEPSVFHLGEGQSSPSATVEDVAWLEGRRVGAGFGGEIEEMWSSPSGGGMAGLVRLEHNGVVTLYETCVILEVEGTLELRLKHLGPDLGIWDDGNDSLTFRLVKVEPNAVHFEGLSYVRSADGSVATHLQVKRRDSSHRIDVMVLKPVPLVEGGSR
ncbi:DUF6265 family protein [Synoicihabitans lomoniglobus]|uniref:DUF6265 family protein n=1 Tax=Synoicihabitans lomoniglobus TaxID=2909285 RepID=A0AAF0I2W5_9BACT|nr:DUF6265 family protein [Opitutaceae bacterium LMO-M01]WED65774.1 DUF6265 family protein [Opitutaceae bacterium LMO-M01]